MKYFLTSFFLLALVSCQCPKKDIQTTKTTNTSEVTTVYYLIRHAEKDRSNTKNKDPKLTEVGIQRAKNWASFFETVKFDQIYSTDYKRTQQTAIFTATKQNIAVQSYNPNNLYNEDFKTLTKGETVLIVGHSNTTPSFVNAIIGNKQYPPIKEDNNENLYIVPIIR